MTKGNAFNAGQPQAGMVFKFPLKAEEVMVHIKCDVLSWMTGYVGVVSHPYFAVTDATGAFTIANVPAGKHTIQVWQEQYGPLTQTVEVKAGATTTADFSYTGNEEAIGDERARRAGTRDPERCDGGAVRCCSLAAIALRSRMEWEVVFHAIRDNCELPTLFTAFMDHVSGARQRRRERMPVDGRDDGPRRPRGGCCQAAGRPHDGVG